MNRTELQHLAEMRLREARLLLREGEYSGAYYLAGYSVECALKACIAKGINQYDFPDKNKFDKSYSHNLRQLATLTEVWKDLVTAKANNPNLKAAWQLVASWDETSRYKFWTKDAAGDMIEAVGANEDGVLPWIMQRW